MRDLAPIPGKVRYTSGHVKPRWFFCLCCISNKFVHEDARTLVKVSIIERVAL